MKLYLAGFHASFFSFDNVMKNQHYLQLKLKNKIKIFEYIYRITFPNKNIIFHKTINLSYIFEVYNLFTENLMNFLIISQMISYILFNFNFFYFIIYYL